MVVNIPLLAIALPVTLANPPVTKLLPCTLPVADTNPVTNNPLAANTAKLAVPATLTATLLLLKTFTLLVPFDMAAESIPVSCEPLPRIKLPVMLPVVLKLVPVAAPILGVVRAADALTIILPLPSNAVVELSTRALNTVPVRLIPAAVLAVYT